MTIVISWRNHPDVRSVPERTAAALGEGRLVAFPTETGYVVAADARRPEAVARLEAHRAAGRPLTLAVGGLGQVLALMPDLGVLGQRLARRCWPGPVTMQRPAEGLAGVPPEVIERLRENEWVSVRSPAHSAILHALLHLGMPLALAPLKTPAGGEAASLEALGEEVAFAVEDGTCAYPDGATVVRLKDENWEMTREGAVDAGQLQVRLACVVVFVCTGNTCRSPMAEGLFKKMLSERLGCPAEELPSRGYVVLSAGLSAYPDEPAALPAVEVLRGRGVDLSTHRSQPLGRELAAQADVLVGMTETHRQTLLAHFQYLNGEPRLLSPEGADLADPVGQDESVYRACADQIARDLRALERDLIGQ
jgi:protein-tyrosine phosphatase